MTTLELIAENRRLRERAEKAEAELAEHHKNKRSWNAFMEETFTPEFRNEAGVEYLKLAIEGNEFRIGVLEAELSALKIDARYIAENWERTDNDYNTKCGVDEVAKRILEATKGD